MAQREEEKDLTPEDPVVVEDEVEEIDGEEEGEEKETPLWMSEETEQEEDSETSENVPVSAIMKVKAKLKGKISEKDDEITQLRHEIEQLKKGGKAPAKDDAAKPVRPKLRDFDSDEEYEQAMDEYEERKLEYQASKITSSKQQEEAQTKRAERLAQSVDGHYERAAKLIQEAGLNPDTYKHADTTIKEAIEDVLPRAGEAVFNELVSLMGEGSEKTMFYVGRNKGALTEFKTLLQEDKTGLKAAYHLGKLTEKVNGTKKQPSRAPRPAAQIQGDEGSTAKGSALQRKYDAAHKKGHTQEAYNIKKQARQQGVDTTNWR